MHRFAAGVVLTPAALPTQGYEGRFQPQKLRPTSSLSTARIPEKSPVRADQKAELPAPDGESIRIAGERQGEVDTDVLAGDWQWSIGFTRTMPRQCAKMLSEALTGMVRVGGSSICRRAQNRSFCFVGWCCRLRRAISRMGRQGMPSHALNLLI
jgi:hypothetical protein